MKEYENGDTRLSPVGDVREWCLHQLESAVKKLTERVLVIAYTRNPQAMAAVARQCDELDAVLTACEFQIQQHDREGYQAPLSSLLLLEAHRLLADARAMLALPPAADPRGDNVVALKRDYADLTDAAFERLLASSDIPQFLSTPAHWQDESEPAPSGASRPRLQLVYSRRESDSR